jgi:hypothetical protein
MNKIFTGIIFFISSEIVYARSPDDLQQLPDFGNLNVIIYGLSIAAVIMATTTTFFESKKKQIIALFCATGVLLILSILTDFYLLWSTFICTLAMSIYLLKSKD